MSSYFEKFVIDILNDVPTYIYLLLLGLLVLFAVITILSTGWKKGLMLLLRFVLIEYIFLLLCFTVIFRIPNENIEHHFIPFWSYAAYNIEVRPDLLPENIMNIVVFVPLGLMLGGGFEDVNWWKVLIVGLFISVIIEVIQYFLNLGVSEFDDVFHNTLGCIIGYGILKVGVFCENAIKGMR